MAVSGSDEGVRRRCKRCEAVLHARREREEAHLLLRARGAALVRRQLVEQLAQQEVGARDDDGDEHRERGHLCMCMCMCICVYVRACMNMHVSSEQA